MGIRQSLKKELMGIDASVVMTADDIRDSLATAIKHDPTFSKANFALMSRFNENHSLLGAGLPGKETVLVFERHRLFKEVLYNRISVINWVTELGGKLQF